VGVSASPPLGGLKHQTNLFSLLILDFALSRILHRKCTKACDFQTNEITKFSLGGGGLALPQITHRSTRNLKIKLHLRVHPATKILATPTTTDWFSRSRDVLRPCKFSLRVSCNSVTSRDRSFRDRSARNQRTSSHELY